MTARALLLIVLVGVLGAVPTASGQLQSSSGTGYKGAAAPLPQEAELVDAINGLRAQHGLRPLVPSPALAALSRAHSQDMLDLGYFDHTTPSGGTFEQRVGALLGSEGYKTWDALENIDYGEGQMSAADVLDHWINSPPHLANLLDPDVIDIGVGLALAQSAPGFYDGLDGVTTVTAVFGPPQPELGKSVLASPVAGTVLVRLPGTQRFVPLTATELLVVGSELDTTGGRVRIASVADADGTIQTADFYQGRFIVGYASDFPTVTPPAVVTDLRLSGPLTGCKTSKARRTSAALGPAKAPKPPERHLWGSGKGRFRTTGTYASATVRGTIWFTQDTCTGTLVRVQSGIVDVYDVGLRKHVLVGAGKSYVARRRK